MSDLVPENEKPASSATKNKPFSAQLNEVAEAIDASNSLSAALRRAIDDLLGLAAGTVGSAVASVLVRDGHEGGLRFLTATSGVTEELLALRLPPGAGIAGLVFSTQQPMAVADVAHDGSFWSEADRRTGFKTITLLATPLRANGEMVGVLEFVNRPGDPPYPAFTPAEMNSAARYADPIAQLVEAHEIATLVESLFNYSIKACLTTPESNRASDLREWLEQSPAAAEHRDLLRLWISLREVITHGDAERELCRSLLEALAQFTEKRAGGAGLFGIG